MVWDILKWILLIFFGLFILWVITGGPERAEQKDLRPIISGPSGVGSPVIGPSVQGSPAN